MRQTSGRPAVDDWLLVGGSFIFLIACWEGLSRFGVVDPLVLPPPSAIAVSLWKVLLNIVSGGYMLRHTYVTLYEMLAGFVVGCLVGGGLGLLVSEFRWADRILTPYIVALNAAPKIALAPLFTIWFGFGLTSKVVMAAFISFFPLFINVVAGLQGVDELQLRLMRSLLATRWQTFVKLRLPAAMPYIFAGLKSAMILAVIGAIVGEFVGAAEGLGYVIKIADSQLRVADSFASIILLSVIGVVLFQIVEIVRRRIVFWQNDGVGG